MRRGDVVEVVLPAQTTVDVVEQTTSLIEVPLATVRGLKSDTSLGKDAIADLIANAADGDVLEFWAKIEEA